MEQSAMSLAVEDPITMDILEDPVILNCGHTFSRATVTDMLDRKPECPMCRAPTQPGQFTQNYAMQDLIEVYRKNKEKSEKKQKEQEELKKKKQAQKALKKLEEQRSRDDKFQKEREEQANKLREAKELIEQKDKELLLKQQAEEKRNEKKLQKNEQKRKLQREEEERKRLDEENRLRLEKEERLRLEEQKRLQLEEEKRIQLEEEEKVNLAEEKKKLEAKQLVEKKRLQREKLEERSNALKKLQDSKPVKPISKPVSTTREELQQQQKKKQESDEINKKITKYANELGKKIPKKKSSPEKINKLENGSAGDTGEGIIDGMLGFVGVFFKAAPKDKGLLKDETNLSFVEKRGMFNDTPVWKGKIKNEKTNDVDDICIKLLNCKRRKKHGFCDESDIFVYTDRYREFIGFGSSDQNLQGNKLYQVLADEYKEDHTQKLDVLREIMLLFNLKHPNILKVSGVFKKQTRGPSTDFCKYRAANNPVRGPFYFMLSPFENCDLDFYATIPNNFLHPYDKKRPFIENVKTMLIQILLSVSYLHSADIVHRDLQPSSILVSEMNNSVKLCLASFSDARSLINAKSNHLDALPKFEGAYFGWKSPDIILTTGSLQEDLGPDIWKSCDVWSVGTIFGWLLCQRPLFGEGLGTDAALKEMLRYKEIRDSCKETFCEKYHVINALAAWLTPPDLSLEQVVMDCSVRKGDYSDSTKEDYTLALHLLQRMLDIDPETRITAFEALCHPFFTSKRGILEKHHLWHFAGDSSIFSSDNIATFAAEKCPGEFS